MKKATRRFFSSILCVLLCGMFCLFSSALSTNEYGLGLTASSHEADGTAAISLKLKNSNDFDVSDINITGSTPDGLVLKSGNSFSTDILAAGDTYEAELVFAAANSPASVPVEAPIVKKGNEKAVIAAVLATAVIIAAAVIFARKHRKTAAMVLAITMLIPFVGIFGVHAVGTDEARSFTLEDSISLDGKIYPLSITVSYSASTAKNSYFEFETDGGNSSDESVTVTRFTADFSGKATASESVKSVTYEIRSESDNFAAGTVGEAELDGCEWSIDNLHLKPGENTVTFTATLASGEKQTQVQNIFYDRGELYTRTASEEAEENGTQYVKEIVNIYFDINTTEERIAEILAKIGAERVGEVNDIAMVQARVEAESLDELNKKCDEFEKYTEVIGAGIEEILPLEINVTTNDPWSTYTSNKETVNEDIPGGYNWHAEAIQAYSAWEYQDYYSKITVGIVDGPVMPDHEDFNDLIKFNSRYSSHNTFATTEKDKAKQAHGTHVAGIIGATPNNGLGGAGILWDVDIFAANFQSSSASSDTVGYVVSAVSNHITNGAKAVNLSLGMAPQPASNFNPYENQYTLSQLSGSAKQCALGMNTLLKSGKEFVVVQSAGNGVVDTRISSSTYRSIEANLNGLYCSIVKNGSYGSLSSADVLEVYNRIIVVGAAQNQSSSSNGAKFKMAAFSNAGDRVDIYAPGYLIFSSVTPQANSSGTYNINYGLMSGTSQAAPIVTAVAALCFAINDEFTGAKVKELICAEENTRCIVYDDTDSTSKGSNGVYYDLHPIEGDGRMLSMKLVAEAALRTVCSKADYKFFNQMITIAQSLNPNDFKNFEIMQSVLDSITPDFYNLYEFQQEQVTNKAMEIADALDKLEERGQADYSDVEKAKAEAAALNKADYFDFSGVTAAVNAVVYGKYADEQAEVDSMAKAIRDAINALELLVSISSDYSDIIADSANNVIVFTTDYIDLYQESLAASGGYSISFSSNSTGTYSTDAEVTLSKEGCADITYAVAVLGDIDGNGKSDANDAFLTQMYAVGLLEPVHSVYAVAADANCDGIIDANDSMLIQESAIFNNMIFNDYVPGE